MSLRKPLIPLLCLMALSLLAQNPLKPYEEYIAKYADIAVNQQKKHGIPASITLAQGLLESGAGKSNMAVRSNNHFGIKCHNTWTGDTVVFYDDGENSCFRKYEKVDDSFDDHSMFLVKGKRYATLFMLDVSDYKGWAYGLKAAGYATDPSYADKLIRIIETYGLNKLADRKNSNLASLDKAEQKVEQKADKQLEKQQKAAEKKRLKAEKDSLEHAAKLLKKANRKSGQAVRDSLAGAYSIFTNEVLQNVKDYQAIPVKRAAQTVNPRSVHDILYLGTTPYVKAQYGDSFESISDEFGLTVSRIRKINEFPLQYVLTSGEPVYLDTKTSWWEGEKPYHVVQAGESMHAIAQKYALKLDALYKMNNLTPNSVLKPGTKIKLRNPDQLSPVVRAMNEAFNKTDSTTVNSSKTN